MPAYQLDMSVKLKDETEKLLDISEALEFIYYDLNWDNKSERKLMEKLRKAMQDLNRVIDKQMIEQGAFKEVFKEVLL